MPHNHLLKSFIICTFILLMNEACTSSKEKPVPAPENPTTITQDTTKPVKVETAHLLGRWLRPDGGYILEIKSGTPDGKLDVSYFNPNPIHVGKAEWVVKDGKQFVLVELQDVNYPGSTYGLEYIVAQDKLAGTYYQAVEKSTYDVEFVREK